MRDLPARPSRWVAVVDEIISEEQLVIDNEFVGLLKDGKGFGSNETLH
jgi:hypothetical protein